MSSIQYTIRNIPEPLNRYLRKKSRISGKSLNQVIIDELSEKVPKASGDNLSSLDWLIGSGMDKATLEALDEDDRIQKELASKDI